LKRPDLLGDSRFSSNPERVEHRTELHEELAATFREESSEHWLETLSEHGVPVTPIQPIDQVVNHEQVAAIGAIAEVPHPRLPQFRLINTPVQVDGDYYPIRRVPPSVGEHTEEIRARRWAGPHADQRGRETPPGTRG
ncbi:MAG: CoA transferase, partial [Acidimicrobiales bacterium]|nr:CoA transferase [Acidimicrobiales bacterium]